MTFKISKFFLYASVFAVALVTTSTLFPFIVGKYTWFRASVFLSVIFFLMGVITDERAGYYLGRLKKLVCSPVVIAVSAFVFMFLLAGLLGVDPGNSFWSNFERGEGGLQLLTLYLFFLLLATLFDEEKQWSLLFKCVFVTALVMIGYGVLAGVQANPSVIGPAFGTPGFRFQGSIGNPAYVAVYLVFVLFYALYLLLTEYRHKLKSAGAILTMAASAVYLVFFFLAATRGAFLGLVAAALVFLSYMAIASKKLRKPFLAVAGALVILFAIGFTFRNSAAVQKLPFARIFDLSVTTQTFHDRATIWKMAWDGFKARPVLGVGPENFLYVFDHYFNINYYQPPASFGAWFDRAHSIIFDSLAETGILGFLSLASMFFIFYLQFFRKKIANAENLSPEHPEHHKLTHFSHLSSSARALIFSLPIAYLVQGLVLFDILPTYIVLFMFFAFATYIFSAHSVKSGETIERSTPQMTIAAIGIAGAVYFLVYGAFLPFLKGQAYVDAASKNVNTISDFETSFNQVFNFPSPVGDEETTKFLFQNIVQIASNPNQPEEVVRELADYIEPHVIPTDTRQLIEEAQLRYIMLQRFRRQVDYDKALATFQKIREIGPKLPPALYSLFNLYAGTGNATGTKEVGEAILKLWPQDTRIAEYLKKK